MFVGSFGGDPIQFQFDVADAIDQFKASGVTNLLVDVTENGGSFLLRLIPGNLTRVYARRIHLSGTIPCCIPCWY